MLFFNIAIFLLIVALVVIGYLYTPFFSQRYENRMESPPTSDTHNPTNYHMSAMEEEELADLSPEEAKNLLEKWKKAGYIPAPRDFHQLQRIIKEGEE